MYGQKQPFGLPGEPGGPQSVHPWDSLFYLYGPPGPPMVYIWIITERGGGVPCSVESVDLFFEVGGPRPNLAESFIPTF